MSSLRRMFGKRGGLGLMVAGIAFGCAAAPASLRFGVASQATDEAPCVTFAGPLLEPGTLVTIEAFEPRRPIPARIRSTRDSCGSRSGVLGTSYALDVAPGVSDIGLAPATVNGEHRTDLTFARCSGSEGVHLTAWRDGAKAWHQYHYLGYDIEPDCPPGQPGP